MLSKYLKIETLSVVLIGDFNPVIFQPFWLSSKNLIRNDEAENAKIEVIHNEIVKYEIKDWLKIEITRNRCEFKTTKDSYFNPLKDLVVSIFKLLKETPVKSLGVNFIYDLSLLDKDKYLQFGESLSNLNIWGESLKDPKLLQLDILEKPRYDDNKGSRRVRVSPSNEKINFGVKIDINDHFELINNTSNSGLINLLENNLSISKKNSIDIIEKLIKNINI